MKPIFVKENSPELKKLKNEATKTIDYYDQMREELTQIRNLSGSKEKIKNSQWVYYPWLKNLVRLLSNQDYQELRTTRNKYLITEDEQKKLMNFKVGVLGMSVGNSIVLSLIHTGISNDIKIADADNLDGSNLNRVRAGLYDLGENKTVLTAKQIYEVNPYAKIEIFTEGVDEKNLGKFISNLDLVVEEVDDFALKIKSRLSAKKRGIPVVMITDNAEEVIVDIERYDLDKNYPLFHGFAGNLEKLKLDNLTKEQKIEIATKIVGKENITPRMSKSLSEVGKTLVSWPQLATTVFAGGGIGAYVVKQIALGKKIKSKRFKIVVDRDLIDKSATKS